MTETDMTLLTTWDNHVIDGWFWTEKYDGCRAFWDGYKFWTRGGNVIPAPKLILDEMPHGVQIDGEIWAGRGQFEVARQAVQVGRFTDAVRFVGFDAPTVLGNWMQRMEKVASLLKGNFTFSAPTGIIKSMRHAIRVFENIAYAGGEGIVVRNPSLCRYQTGRSKNALRIKI